MVFETNGRPSDEAVAFIRGYGHRLPQALRAEVIGTIWRHISRMLQVGSAEMVLSTMAWPILARLWVGHPGGCTRLRSDTLKFAWTCG